MLKIGLELCKRMHDFSLAFYVIKHILSENNTYLCIDKTNKRVFYYGNYNRFP